MPGDMLSAAAKPVAAARSALARRRVRTIISSTPQRNSAVVDCIIWSAALITLAFIS
jgi:hypothetical protein